MIVLVLIVVSILGAIGTCAVCYFVTVARLWRADGWRAALLGAVCVPYAYAWCWRHRPIALRVWTAAFTLLVLLVALLETQMG